MKDQDFHPNKLKQNMLCILIQVLNESISRLIKYFNCTRHAWHQQHAIIGRYIIPARAMKNGQSFISCDPLGGRGDGGIHHPDTDWPVYMGPLLYLEGVV